MKAGVVITFLALGLSSIEGLSWWWMHPSAAGLNEPVLSYRPEIGKKLQSTSEKPADQSEMEAAGQPEITPLPDIYAKSAPMLRCSSGQVNYAKLSDTSGIHLAFFEWDGTDTGSVLEAFRHVPEACMGSIGMILVSKEKPISYTVDGVTLVFDHSIFREPSQGGGGVFASPLVHAYRAVWVSGMSDAIARNGITGGDSDPLRTIRMKAAVSRYRPAHARVIQGAVRGMPSQDSAWQAFESTMLSNLHMANR